MAVRVTVSPALIVPPTSVALTVPVMVEVPPKSALWIVGGVSTVIAVSASKDAFTATMLLVTVAACVSAAAAVVSAVEVSPLCSAVAA